MEEERVDDLDLKAKEKRLVGTTLSVCCVYVFMFFFFFFFFFFYRANSCLDGELCWCARLSFERSHAVCFARQETAKEEQESG